MKLTEIRCVIIVIFVEGNKFRNEINRKYIRCIISVNLLEGNTNFVMKLTKNTLDVSLVLVYWKETQIP
jgi:hypothetical protein